MTNESSFVCWAYDVLSYRNQKEIIYQLKESGDVRCCGNMNRQSYREK